MLIEHADIKHLIPHRFPMLLIDRVLSVELGSQLVAVKTISGNEPCFTDLQDNTSAKSYAYPCSLVVESFGQASAILYSLSLRSQGKNKDGVVLLGSLSSFTFYADIFPGDTIEHRVVLGSCLSDAAICKGEVWVNEKMVARSEQMLVLHRPSYVLRTVS